MKLHLDQSLGIHRVTAQSEDFIEIDGRRHGTSLIVLPDRLIRDWPVARLDRLESGHFAALIELRPEIVLLGSGRRHCFPPPDRLATLFAAGMGVEVMATAAACRTYNILVAEGRRVAAALILETRAEG